MSSLHLLKRQFKTESPQETTHAMQSSKSTIGDKVQIRENEQEEMLNKSNQCDFVSLYTGNLRKHLKTHTGEK